MSPDENERSQLSQLEVDITGPCTRCNEIAVLTAGVCRACSRITEILAGWNVDCLGCGEVVAGNTLVEGRCETCRQTAEPVAVIPDIDPIDAFAARVRAERALVADREAAERLAEGLERAAAIARQDEARRLATQRSAVWAVEKADETTGAVVFWQLGGTVSLPELRSAMSREGAADELAPTGCSPEVALSRAVREQQASDVLVRKHPLGGWALVHESKGVDHLEYAEGARFDLDAGGVAVYGATDATLTERVNAAFARNLGSLSTTDISAWLVKLAEGAFNGVALRERGGVYFVPRDKVSTFRAIKLALASVQPECVVHEIPALKSAEAIAAVLDAVTREARAAIIELQGELNDPQGVGTRAATNRVKQIDTLLAKIRGYETLLGRSFAETIDEIVKLQAAFGKSTTMFANLEID